MRLEIGAGAAAGRAGGVLWSSAILAAISLRGAAFTSPLPAPARSAEPAAAPARLRPPPSAPPARAARQRVVLLPAPPAPPAPLPSHCWPLPLASSVSLALWAGPAGCVHLCRGSLLAQAIHGLSLGHHLRTACVPFCLSFPLSNLLVLCPEHFPFPLEAYLLAPE